MTFLGWLFGQSGTVPYANAQWKFSFDYPSNWKIQAKKSGQASSEFVEGFSNERLYPTSESLLIFAFRGMLWPNSRFSVSIRSFRSFGEFVASVNRVKREGGNNFNFRNKRLVSTEVVQIGNLPTYRHVSTHDFFIQGDCSPFVEDEVWMLGSDVALLLQFLVPPQQYARTAARIHALLDSFKCGFEPPVMQQPAQPTANSSIGLAEFDLIAARDGRFDHVKGLVESDRSKVTAANDIGMTLLHSAAAFGHIEIVEFLISNGADLNCCNSKKQTPLHLAAARGHVSIAEALATMGANVNAMDDSGLTPMDIAAAMHHPTVMTALLKFDARVTRNNPGT